MRARNSKPSLKMNTTLDESLLARWLDDETLDPNEQSALAAVLAKQPELHDLHRHARAWRSEVAQLPAAQEPPYPDFFNARILHQIQLPVASPTPTRSAPWRLLQHWLMPAAACAGMALAFWIGTTQPGSRPQATVTAATSIAPVFYTPELGVDAEWYDSEAANATVIVLQGVHAIPDATDFSAHFPLGREMDRTAIRANPPTDSRTQ